MAKRKSYPKKKPARRRSRVGSVNTGDSIMQVGFMLIGVAAGGIMNKTFLAGKSPMVQALVPLAAGIALPMFVKSDLGKYAGLGLAAAGGNKLLQKFNIAGLGDDSVNVPLMISGDGLSLIAGADDDDLVMAGIGLDDYDDSMAGDNEALTMLAGLDEDDE